MTTYRGSCHCGRVRFDVEPFDGWAINVRCLDGVDLDSLPVRRIHGSRIRHDED